MHSTSDADEGIDDRVTTRFDRVMTPMTSRDADDRVCVTVLLLHRVTMRYDRVIMSMTSRDADDGVTTLIPES